MSNNRMLVCISIIVGVILTFRLVLQVFANSAPVSKEVIDTQTTPIVLSEKSMIYEDCGVTRYFEELQEFVQYTLDVIESEQQAEVERLEEERLEQVRIAEEMARIEKQKLIDKQNEKAKSIKLADKSDGRRLLGVFEATAYTDNMASQGKWVGQTATGRKPQVGVIAVDPKVIPLGTKLYVEGYNGGQVSVAGDVGGLIKGERVDLFFNTAKECKNFGRQDVKIWIID